MALTPTTIEALAKVPVVPVFGKIRFQPMDSEEVAEHHPIQCAHDRHTVCANDGDGASVSHAGL